jgi:hypothetical protein
MHGSPYWRGTFIFERASSENTPGAEDGGPATEDDGSEINGAEVRLEAPLGACEAEGLGDRLDLPGIIERMDGIERN